MNFSREIKKARIDKGWKQQDLQAALVELGVPKDDIVLAYQPLYKRAYHDLAIA